MYVCMYVYICIYVCVYRLYIYISRRLLAFPFALGISFSYDTWSQSELNIILLRVRMNHKLFSLGDNEAQIFS